MISPALRIRSGLMFIILLLVLLLPSPIHAQSSTQPTGTLTVHIEGLDSDKGTVRIALDNEQNYDVDGNVRAGSLSIQDGVARWTVEDVPHGTYAVRVHHDANGNGKMDTSMFGIPQEAFGFSNNAQGTFGPPAFEEAAFTLAADSLSMTIRTE